METTITKNLKSSETILDNEFKFYQKYLLEYSKIQTSEELICANAEDTEKFNMLSEIYFLSSNAVSKEEQQDADSLTFFVSGDVIIPQGNNYYINIKALLELAKQFNVASEKTGQEAEYKDDQESKGTAYTKKNQ